MKCVKHGTEAIGVCTVCGNAVCEECAVPARKLYCRDCAVTAIQQAGPQEGPAEGESPAGEARRERPTRYERGHQPSGSRRSVLVVTGLVLVGCVGIGLYVLSTLTGTNDVDAVKRAYDAAQRATLAGDYGTVYDLHSTRGQQDFVRRSRQWPDVAGLPPREAFIRTMKKGVGDRVEGEASRVLEVDVAGTSAVLLVANSKGRQRKVKLVLEDGVWKYDSSFGTEEVPIDQGERTARPSSLTRVGGRGPTDPGPRPAGDTARDRDGGQARSTQPAEEAEKRKPPKSPEPSRDALPFGRSLFGPSGAIDRKGGKQAARPSQLPVQKDPKSEVVAFVNECKRQAQEGDVDGALRKLRDALGRWPEYDAEVYFSMAICVDKKWNTLQGEQLYRMWKEKAGYFEKALEKLDLGGKFAYDKYGNRVSRLRESLEQARQKAARAGQQSALADTAAVIEARRRAASALKRIPGPVRLRMADGSVMSGRVLQADENRIELERQIRVNGVAVGESRMLLAWDKIAPKQVEQLLGKADGTPTSTGQAEATRKHDMTIELGGGVKMEMLYVSSGRFLMGSKSTSQESPPHEVLLTRGFYLGKTEVTRGQFAAFVSATGHKTTAEVEGSATFFEWAPGGGGKWIETKGGSWRNPGFPQDDSHPVVCVSWTDADRFVTWLSRRMGKRFRLPTEAEWEYACRAGSTGTYCFGDDHDRLGEYAWFGKNSGDHSHPVAQKRPNAWGLHDMHGNVWEMCADWYDEGYYQKSPQADPPGPPSGKNRIARGGLWLHRIPDNLRSAFRGQVTPVARYNYNGFRVACDDAP